MNLIIIVYNDQYQGQALVDQSVGYAEALGFCVVSALGGMGVLYSASIYNRILGSEHELRDIRNRQSMLMHVFVRIFFTLLCIIHAIDFGFHCHRLFDK